MKNLFKKTIYIITFRREDDCFIDSIIDDHRWYNPNPLSTADGNGINWSGITYQYHNDDTVSVKFAVLGKINNGLCKKALCRLEELKLLKINQIIES